MADISGWFLRFIVPAQKEHLTNEQLADLFCNEGRLLDRMAARQHLAECRRCTLRQEELEGPRADQALNQFRDLFDEPTPDPRHDPYGRKLREQARSLRHLTRPKQGGLRASWKSLLELSPMNPALVTCMVFAFATILSFCFWWQQRTPKIGENALLVRAEKWDRPAAQGVVYQAVRITMTKQSKEETISRSIYRDAQGKRKLKAVKLDTKQEELKDRLTQAGLDWDQPISASGFQGWHDHQRVREDQITRAGKHLLMLTTSVPEGSVSEQSLTVRDTDFHPVRRTVAFRDSGTIEIAEVDFKILPWSKVDTGLFVPLEAAESVLAARPRVLAFPRIPEMLTDGQLDEAELSARLILSQLHADTNEQVSIHRAPQGVVVDALVETDERKRTLQSQLRMVPHLTVSIQSVAELKSKPESHDEVVSIATASPANQPSQLQTYLQGHGHSISDINVLAERLFNAALTISQESKAIADLETRFTPGEQKTAIASATLSELIYTHKERLDAALKQERASLAEVQSADVPQNHPSLPNTSSMLDAAERNLTLAKELTLTNTPTTRSAEQILAEMSVTVRNLTTLAHEAYWKPQGDSILSGKK